MRGHLVLEALPLVCAYEGYDATALCLSQRIMSFFAACMKSHGRSVVQDSGERLLRRMGGRVHASNNCAITLRHAVIPPACRSETTPACSYYPSGKQAVLRISQGTSSKALLRPNLRRGRSETMHVKHIRHTLHLSCEQAAAQQFRARYAHTALRS